VVSLPNTIMLLLGYAAGPILVLTQREGIRRTYGQNMDVGWATLECFARRSKNYIIRHRQMIPVHNSFGEE